MKEPTRVHHLTGAIIIRKSFNDKAKLASLFCQQHQWRRKKFYTTDNWFPPHPSRYFRLRRKVLSRRRPQPPISPCSLLKVRPRINWIWAKACRRTCETKYRCFKTSFCRSFWIVADDKWRISSFVFETSFFEMPFFRSVSFGNVTDDNLDKSMPFWAVIYWNVVFPKCPFCEVSLLEMSRQWWLLKQMVAVLFWNVVFLKCPCSKIQMSLMISGTNRCSFQKSLFKMSLF